MFYESRSDGACPVVGHGLEGKPFPRISMSVMKGFQGGLRISISKKEKPGGWWGDNFDLPPELLPEMAEMLNEAYEGL